MIIQITNKNWENSSEELLEWVRMQNMEPLGGSLIIFQNIWGLVAELIGDITRDFLIEAVCNENSLKLRFHNTNIGLVQDAVSLLDTYDAKELKELYMSYAREDNWQHIGAIEIARRLKRLQAKVSINEKIEILIAWTGKA